MQFRLKESAYLIIKQGTFQVLVFLHILPGCNESIWENILKDEPDGCLKTLPDHQAYDFYKTHRGGSPLLYLSTKGTYHF